MGDQWRWAQVTAPFDLAGPDSPQSFGAFAIKVAR